jgi:hypothetical protein
MYELKKIGKVFTSKFTGTGPSSYKKRLYRAAVSQSLRNTALSSIVPRRIVKAVLFMGINTFLDTLCYTAPEELHFKLRPAT